LEQRAAQKIVVVDRMREGDKWKNIAKRELFDIVHPDDFGDFLEDHGEQIKAIFHMGAISSTTETDVDLIMDTNFRLTRDLWDWCVGYQVPFIYASSAATYGSGERGFVDDASIEALAKLKPLNPYGWSKQLFDRRVARMMDDGAAKPPQWVGLKFFNVYGPNEYHKGTMQSVISHVFPKAEQGQTASLFKSHNLEYEDGGQLRDFVYVDDCVDVMMWMLDHPDVSGLFNCGTGQARSFKDLATAVYAALDHEVKIEYVPMPEHLREKYQYFTQADMTKLRSVGYSADFTPLEEGVRRYVQDFLFTNDRYR
jgi:ADP-L-glycero-D-manno-heptose 6-epimerase